MHRFGFNAWQTQEEREREHLLHLLWNLEEEGIQQLETVKDRWVHDDDPDPIINVAAEEGLVITDGRNLLLTDRGREQAEDLVRRFRLAECLFSEVFLLEEMQYEKSACEFEHILTPEVTDSVCTLLGHPPICPHGRPIPRGACCAKFSSDVKPIVVRLSDLSPGDVAKVVFITFTRSKHLDKLDTIGLTPGAMVKLHQRRPSFILDLGETQIAIDREIAQEIFVKKMG